MTPQEFIAKWKKAQLSERSAAQQHFLDVCYLLGQPKPAEADPEGAWYTFERGVHKTGGGEGWADVWMKGKFAWEYKRKGRNLAEAYLQLLLYEKKGTGSGLRSKDLKTWDDGPVPVPIFHP